MADVPPDPRQMTEKRIEELSERRARLLRELAHAEEELRALTELNESAPPED
jgi:hypothetical protein